MKLAVVQRPGEPPVVALTGGHGDSARGAGTIGRLAPNVTVETAQAECRRINRDVLSRLAGEPNAGESRREAARVALRDSGVIV
jgi:hypothetical protein